MSAHQLHRTLEVTYNTAWFLAHRIREAMRSGELAPFGSQGGAVEADETYIGRGPEEPVVCQGVNHKIKILTLLDRETGAAQSRVVEFVNTKTITAIVSANLAKEARLMTDEASVYRRVGATMAEHGTTTHGKGEYVSRVDPTIHTNTVEGYFSIFKRGMKGVYQHASKKHMHRYLAEFDFRYSNRVALGVNDVERAEVALKGVVGKRLTYQRAGERA